MNALLKSGRVVRLKDGIRVRVIEKSVQYRMLRFKLPGRGTPYWALDGSLLQDKKK
ncbi:MAG: hypothetical protein M0Z75_02165 [Nitrospiraceae bacterium]|nr:hypothetical protein [Nitrospiraceae bacterium]